MWSTSSLQQCSIIDICWKARCHEATDFLPINWADVERLIRRGQPPQNCQFRTKITFYGPANADIQILIWNIMNEYLFPAKIIFDLCDSETSEKDRILHNWICPKWPFPRMLWSRWENWSRKLWRSAVNWNKTKSLSKILLNDIFENQTGLFWMQS